MHREERTMTTIYLIRHAEAEGNVFRRIHGQYDSCVTPNGRRQIAALAQRFAGIPVDAVYAISKMVLMLSSLASLIKQQVLITMISACVSSSTI